MLAGNGLLTHAFEVLVSDEAIRLNGYDKCAKAVSVLSECAGVNGMLGGQMIDLESEGKQSDVEHLKVMDNKKTGALMIAAAKLGCISAGATEEQLVAACQYASDIGLAFQIIDDMLDITSTTEELGKPIGSDTENEKSTYAALLGLEKCRRISEELTENAISALDIFGDKAGKLKDFAIYLLKREK